MECASQVPVAFSDIVCQMHDMLNPEVPGRFTLRDLRRQRALAGTMFNILFNLNKFVAFETRDPFVVRQEKAADPDAGEWDRCAPLHLPPSLLIFWGSSSSGALLVCVLRACT